MTTGTAPAQTWGTRATEPIDAIRPTTTGAEAFTRIATAQPAAATITAPHRTNADVDTAFDPGGCGGGEQVELDVVVHRSAIEAAADAQLIAQLAAMYAQGRPRAEQPPVRMPEDRSRPHPFRPR